jgi:hypothetical protein
MLRCGWTSPDGKVIIAVRGLRTFAHSAASVLLAIYLDLQGFSLVEIGLFLTIGPAARRFGPWWQALWETHWGADAYSR